MNFFLWKGITVGLSLQLARRAGGSRGLGKASALSAILLGLGAMSGVQAATLTCGTPLRVNTADKAQWSTDARYVAAPQNIATIIDNYRWGGGWLDLSTNPNHPASPPRNLAGTPLQGKWLSFGATADETTPGQYPAVNTVGVVADGAWVAGRATFIYNESINIGSNVNLATIKIQGSGSADNDAQLAVRAHTLPGGVDNLASATPWTQATNLLGGSWTALAPINVDGSANGLGFYYGDNTIGLALSSEPTTAGLPTGIVADFEITADCLTDVPPPPTAALICPAGNKAGDPIRIGPYYTNARDWKWARRTNAAGTALEDVPPPEQTLYDDYMYRSYFRPANLPAGQSTLARWLSPGTTSPAGGDVPGVPYPEATGMSKAGYYGSVFTMNQPITVGNNINLANIRLEGRFGFDDTGDSVFVQPVGSPAPTTFPSNLLNDGYGAFTPLTTAPTQGFKQGQNIIGLVLDGGQAKNSCAGGTCAMAAIAEFYVTGVCTGDAPIDTPPSTSSVTPVPTLDLAGLGLLGLLGAGMGAFALRRRKREQ